MDIHITELPPEAERLTRTLARAVRTEDWEGTSEEAESALTALVLAARDDEACAAFLDMVLTEESIGAAAWQINSGQLNDIVEVMEVLPWE